MHTTRSHTRSAPAAKSATAPKESDGPFGRGCLGLFLLFAFFMALIAWGAKACASMEGGPVRSAADFQAQVMATKQAGERTVGLLFPGASARAGSTREGSSSCVDDFGFDDDGVTRDEPIYEWELEFGSRHGYRSALADLRADWKEQGYEVEDIPAPARGEPGAGLPGIGTTDGHGIKLTLRPDYYSGEPVVFADGGCMRHDDPYDYDYDGDGEPGW